MRNTVAMIFTLVMATVIYAQDNPAINLSLNHLAISVKDVNRSAAFYKNILRLKEIENRTKLDGIRWFSVGKGRELHMISTINEPIVLNKAVHLAFSTSNFDHMIKTLQHNNIPFSDWPGNLNKINIRADGVQQVFFQDPDGYWIEVNSVGAKK